MMECQYCHIDIEPEKWVCSSCRNRINEVREPLIEDLRDMHQAHTDKIADLQRKIDEITKDVISDLIFIYRSRQTK